MIHEKTLKQKILWHCPFIYNVQKTYVKGVHGCQQSKAYLLIPHPISQLIRGYLIKDDVTVIRFLGISFMTKKKNQDSLVQYVKIKRR